MKSNKLIIFAIITIAVVIAATMMSRHRAPTTTLQKEVLFPDLLTKVNDVHSLRLTKQKQTLTLSQNDLKWGIEQAANYPADFGKVRETILAVAEMSILAEKTSNVELYEKLGVEDPELEDASSLLLSLDGASGNSFVTLIVGNKRHSKSSSDKPGLYVRLPDSETALLVEGRLDVSANVSDWFKRELFDIKANRVKHIQIAHPDGTVVKLDRKEDIDDFTLDNLPDDLEMQSNVIISRMGTLLEDIFVDNVMDADQLSGADQTIATIHTFNGLIVTIVSANMNENVYSSFSFSVDESVRNSTEAEPGTDEATTSTVKPGPEEEAENLNSLMAGWAYAIPSFKSELFTRKLEELSRKAGSAEETEASAESKAETN